jgi:LysM repeat protein
MTSIAPRQTSISLGFVTELTVGGETVNLILEKVQDRQVTVYRGGMAGGQRLLVVALLDGLIPELRAPASLQNLAITQMMVELRPEKGSFAFDAAIENAWSITLDSGPTLSIDRLALSVLSVKPPALSGGQNALANLDKPEVLSQQRRVAFEGQFQLFRGEFIVNVTHQFVAPPPGQTPGRTSEWLFSATAKDISITEIIETFGYSQDKLDEYGLRDLRVSLAFSLQQTRSQENGRAITESVYTFRGKLDWDTGITLGSGTETLQIQGLVEISKTSSDRSTAPTPALQGQIAGIVKASIPFFDTLHLSVAYKFSRTRQAGGSSAAIAQATSELVFSLQIGTLLLTATYINIPDPKAPNDPSKNRKLLRFGVSPASGEKPTVGDLIAYVVSLYDPSLVGFELDPPWDELAKQTIALDRFSLEVDLTQKSLTIAYRATLNVLIAKVSDIGLSYQFGSDPTKATQQRGQTRTGSTKKVAIAVNISIPGQPQQRLQWDPVNENPPAVPGSKAPIFDLQFLALGQRVAFAPEIVRQARTIKQFTDVMQQSLVPLPPIKRQENPLAALQESLPVAVSSDPTQPIVFSGQPIQFSAESGWLIGARFSILGAIDLSVIFNDPFIYGVRLGLSGELVAVFSGLEFEILYRRLSDTLGVYRAELTLPDIMRHLEFGVVSLTLPVVAIEIYTNGDFGIDVGFPWKGDFSRSISVTVKIFIGQGGFYFNKLSAETATSVPQVTNGTFNPVIEFGIGLSVGLGKIINKGPLRAEISILIQGLLQGVFATFTPTDTRQNKVTYYKVQGGVAIVGRIYGMVDFKVIQVDIEVLAKVAVLFVVEVYKAIHVALVATVSVRASIKIAFIRIKFEFSLTLREAFVLGSDSTPPWQLAPSGSVGAMAATIPIFSTTNRTPLTVPRRQRPAARRPLTRHAQGRGPRSPLATEATTAVDDTVALAENRLLGHWEAVQFALPAYVKDEGNEDLSDGNGHLRFDIYFQTAFTKAEGSTATASTSVKGIALLFIQNSKTSGDAPASEEDFDELAKLFLKWVIYAYLPSSEREGLGTEPINLDGRSITLEDLEDTYARFAEDLETSEPHDFWQPVEAFLQKNVVFEITATQNHSEIEGTFFPMFPQLEMALVSDDKKDLSVIDFDGHKLTVAAAKALRNYFQQLNKNHNPITDGVLGLPSSSQAGESPNSLSIAQFLFVDYFTLIARSALQSSIDYLREHPREITLESLLNTLGGSQSFQDLAGMLSRFMLHGLRLPAENSKQDPPTTPVYQKTGQQFSLTQSTAETAVASLQLRQSNQVGNWIQFAGGDSTLDYSLALHQTTINQFRQADPQAILSSSVEQFGLCPFYDPTPQRYGFSQYTTWTQNGDANLSQSHGLWELPLGLSDYLKDRPQGATLRLYYTVQGEAGEALQTEEIRNANPEAAYQWATKLTLTIHRVAKADGSGYLPTTYGLDQLDTASQRWLETLLQLDNTEPFPRRLYLLYGHPQGNGNGLIGDDRANVLLVKTNLSGESTHGQGTSHPRIVGWNRAATTGASTDNLRAFLQLIQEHKTVSEEGYYLSYQAGAEGAKHGLPEHLFADGETATIKLLILSGSELNHYSNCLYIPHNHPQKSAIAQETADSANEKTLFAESSDVNYVLQIPPGNLGFRVIRTEPEEDPNSAADEVANLYQLLHYAIADDGQGTFNTTDKDRLPLGPVEIKRNSLSTDRVSDEDDGKVWDYEKVIPVYALAKASASDDSLPKTLKQALNPYNAIGTNFEIELCWQDIYGNRLGAAGELRSKDGVRSKIDLKLGYFDPILGINQWPSVGESYLIQSASLDDKLDLTLALAFDQSKYLPTPVNPFEETRDHVKTDRATYQQIYYQIHDLNLSFKVTTSVVAGENPDFSAEVRAMCHTFVDSVYRYLVTLEYLEPSRVTVAEGSLGAIAQRFGVDIRDLVDLNQDEGLLVAGQSLQVPVAVRIKPTDTLEGIASQLIQPGGDVGAKVREIVTTHSRTAELLAVGTELTGSGAGYPYTTQQGDTFESVAIKLLAQAEDQRVEEALDGLADRLASQPDILAPGILLKTPAGRSQKIAVNATLADIAYQLLSHEAVEILVDREAAIAQKLESLLATNASLPLRTGATLPELRDYVVQAGDTLATLLAQSDWREQVPQVRGLFADGTVLTSSTVLADGDDVSVWMIDQTTLGAIAAAVDPAITVRDLVRANVDQPDLLVAGTHLSETGDAPYPVQPQDSFRRIAMGMLLRQAEPLTLPQIVPVEVNSLIYDVELTQAIYPLTELALSLNRQLNHHRTALATVQEVGNAKNLLGEETLQNRIQVLADEIRTLPGLFGTTDIVLADLLWNTVTDDRSFNQILAALRQKVTSEGLALIVEQTTTKDIAAQNPDLRLRSQPLQIPGRFALNLDGASQLSVIQASPEAVSLGQIATQMGDEVTVAAIAIANQSLTGLLQETTVSAELWRGVFAHLLRLPPDLVESLNEQVLTWTIQSTDTLYTLKSRIEGQVGAVEAILQQEVQQLQQQIGTLQAIYEQVANLEGANIRALRSPLTLVTNSPLSQLKVTLLTTAGTPGQLKPQFHSVPVEPKPGEPQDESIRFEAEAGTLIGQHIDQIARASDDELVSTLKSTLDLLHRLYERSYLKMAMDLLAVRSQQPITVAEVGLALQDLPVIAPGQIWIKPPIEASTTLTLPIRNGQGLRYPKDLLFSVDVQVEMRRDADLIHNAGQADIDGWPAAAKKQVEAVSAYFAPKILNLSSAPTAPNSDFSDRIASLTPFAQAFEQALPGLKLAVGRQGGSIDSANPENSDTLWAVHLGESGIRYNIEEELPYFFAAAPLSNTPWSGEVRIDTYSADSGLDRDNGETRRVDAVDLNALARIYLQALETVLQPEIALPAANDAALQPLIEDLLTVKAELATVISQQVIPVLKSTLDVDSAEYRQRRDQAAAALHKALLANLADAYDIETIVQYNVEVSRAADYHWPPSSKQHQPPRLSGQPIITGAYSIDSINPNVLPKADSPAADKHAFLQTLDFALSPAKIALDDTATPGHSTLTFFFNTETPQRYEGIKVSLAYEVNELEYAINPERAISSWLNFVVPLPQAGIKDVQIPIPLRDFPMPPSLIGHNAVPDPDGFAGDVLSADHIRDWNYVFLYEHPDVAQDAIECWIEYNDAAPLAANPEAMRAGESDLLPLATTLLRFTELYPAIAQDLETLETLPVADNHHRALRAFVTLAEEVARSWQVWQPIAIAQPEQRTVHYTIAETDLGSDPPAVAPAPTRTVTIAPADNFPNQDQKILKIDLPGYRLDRVLQDGQPIYSPPASDPTPAPLTDADFSAPPYQELTFNFSPKTDTSEVETFGDSALPDRQVTVIDLDILDHQNAWAGIRLTRNQNLVPGWDTNPAFVFQTPEVRFEEHLTPLIINDKRWNIADLPGEASTLAEHLKALFQALLPPDIQRPYDLIITGQYAFALATQRGPATPDHDLLATLPVFLTPRFTVEQSTSPTGSDSAMLLATRPLRENITATVQDWWQDNQAPNATGGRFVFSVSLLSHPEETPSDRDPHLPLLVVENLELKLTDISDRTTWLESVTQ